MENKKYSLLLNKDKKKEDDKNKQIQIEKIKEVFKDNDDNNNKNNDNEILNTQLNNYNINSQNIETFKNFSLIKNTINKEDMNFLIYNNKKEKSHSIDKTDNNTIITNKNKNNNISSNEQSNENIENNYNSNKIKNENEARNDKINMNMDNLNITKTQMDIFDKEVNKLYNQHKSNINKKIFQINHPYLHNIKFINNKIESISLSMTKEQRMLPILQKQKDILKKIQINNISKSNSSISKNNNNDSVIEHSTINKDNKSDRIFFKNKNHKKPNLDLNSNYILKTLDNNYNMQFNYSNSSSENQNDILNTKKSNQKKIKFKPYTLEQYKNKYENINNIVLGGLGADIGGENWNKRQKMFERKKEYSDIIKNDNEFKSLNKKNIKFNNIKYEENKSITSKRDSYLSYESNNHNIGNKYKIIKTQNNINNNELKLPLINNKIKNNNSKIRLKKNKKNLNINNIYKINQEHDIEGNEIDFKQLIKQYEEYNQNFKL